MHTHPTLQYMSRYVTNRTVLAPKREDVDEVNRVMLTRMPGTQHESRSVDSAVDDATGVWSPEVCNMHDPAGLPQHHLLLKVGAVVMLLRNMRPELGMCNGTRLILERITPRLLTAMIITEGKHRGRRVTIPMITLQTHEQQLPYTLRRTQFPVYTAFFCTSLRLCLTPHALPSPRSCSLLR